MTILAAYVLPRERWSTSPSALLRSAVCDSLRSPSLPIGCASCAWPPSDGLSARSKIQQWPYSTEQAKATHDSPLPLFCVRWVCVGTTRSDCQGCRDRQQLSLRRWAASLVARARPTLLVCLWCCGAHVDQNSIESTHFMTDVDPKYGCERYGIEAVV